MHPVITIFCAFTRLWAVDRWLENLANIEHDPALTNLAFIVDADEPGIMVRLKRFAKDRGYRDLRIEMNSNWSPNESRVSVRRQRIAEIKNRSKELVRAADGEYIISFEDDTVFDRLESVDQLLLPLLGGNSKVGFVQGVQCGRWGVRMIGAWKVDDVALPTRAETLLPGEGYGEIDAGGFYGYATTRELYLNHDYYSGHSQIWGPDVNFGLWVRQQGLKCLVDWSINFGHNDHNIIVYPDNAEGLTKIVYTKDKLTGRWVRHDTEAS